MTTIEHRELKGMTVRIFIITIVSAVSMVGSVLTTYFELKADIAENRHQTDVNTQITDIRLKVLESQVALLQKEVEDLKQKK